LLDLVGKDSKSGTLPPWFTRLSFPEVRTLSRWLESANRRGDTLDVSDAATHLDTVPAATVVSELGLEGFDVAAEDEPAGIHDPAVSGIRVVAQFHMRGA
jgi:hypothetical protein